MNHLTGPRGREALRALVSARPLLAFDFDGTLCSLGPEPDHSRTLPENLALLRKLAKKVPIAIISGRSVQDLRPRLGFTPRYLVGNHGREGLEHRRDSKMRGTHETADARRAVETVRDWRTALERNWAPYANDSGVFIEDKVYSLSLHYRLSRRPEAARRFLRERIARLEPAPRVIGGKFIFNLTLADAAHKGTALAEILRRERAKTSLFVGDDVTDEDAFALERPGLTHVRVGASRRSKASLYVRDLNGVTHLLEFLNEAL